MPAALSPWQRAYEAWRAAGLAWGHGAPPRERAPKAGSLNTVRLESPPETADAPVPRPAKAKPAKPTKPSKPAKPAPVPRRTAKAKPDPGDVLVAGPPKPKPLRRCGRASPGACASGRRSGPGCSRSPAA